MVEKNKVGGPPCCAVRQGCRTGHNQGRNQAAHRRTNVPLTQAEDTLNQKVHYGIHEPALHTHTCLSYTLTRNRRPMHPVRYTLEELQPHSSCRPHHTNTGIWAANAASAHAMASIHTPCPLSAPCPCTLLPKPPAPRKARSLLLQLCSPSPSADLHSPDQVKGSTFPVRV